MQRDAEAAAASADAARGELAAAAARVEDLNARLAEARAECDLFITEIEVQGQA